MNLATFKNPVSTVRQNLAPHLPGTISSKGKSAQDLVNACDDFVSSSRSGKSPTVDPYGSSLTRGQKIENSEKLSELAEGAQADFETASASTSPLRLHQLSESLNQMGEKASDLMASASDKKSALRKSYGVQVAKTIGWMAAAAGSLLLGLVAAPISVPLVVVTTGLAIRSIAKARTANKELAAKQPGLDREIKQQKGIVADSQEYTSLVSAWEGALGSSNSEVPAPQFAGQEAHFAMA